MTMAELVDLQGRSNSLAFALAVVLREGGAADVDPDAIGIALGNPFLNCAVPDEPDVGLWPMYARDAFLVEAGRLFGRTFRGIHPPETAVGLHAAAEFGQHFDASYRPLIERALEHNQPVLAWRGWAGEFESSWGLIREKTSTHTGFVGTVYAADPTHFPGTPTPLTAPATQVYIVESCELRSPTARQIVDHSARSARTALRNGLHKRFGVETGGSAFQELLNRLRGVESSEAEARRMPDQVRRWIESHLAAVQSAAKYFYGLDGRAHPPETRIIDWHLLYCSQMEEALSAVLETCSASPLIPMTWTECLDPLLRASRVATDAHHALGELLPECTFGQP